VTSSISGSQGGIVVKRAATTSHFAVSGFPSPGTAGATDTVTLLPGNGDGTFRAPVQLATGTSPFAMAVGQFDGHKLPEVAVLGNSTISVLLNDSSSSAPGRAASANSAGQIVGTGLTSRGTRQAFLLTPDEAGIRRGVDPVVFKGVSGSEIAGVVDSVGAIQALAPSAAGEPAPDDTAAPILMQNPLNALPWPSKARVIRWAVRTRPISGLPSVLM
jgi:hypothetical protein